MAEIKPWMMVPSRNRNVNGDVRINVIAVPKWLGKIVLCFATITNRFLDRKFVTFDDKDGDMDASG